MTITSPATLSGGVGILLCAFVAGAQTPLTLRDAIREVRLNSDETRIIHEKSAKLEAMKSELWAAALPNVSAYANAGRGATPFNLGSLPLPGDSSGSMPSVYSTTQNTFNYGIQVQQVVHDAADGARGQACGLGQGTPCLGGALVERHEHGVHLLRFEAAAREELRQPQVGRMVKEDCVRG